MSNQVYSDQKPTTLSDYLPPEYCHEMIAVCAYYKAEKRGFAPGRELKDWYEAEQEIEKQNFYEFQT